jgi:hypothetical protein
MYPDKPMFLWRVEMPVVVDGYHGVEEKWVLVFKSEEEAKEAQEIVEREKRK